MAILIATGIHGKNKPVGVKRETDHNHTCCGDKSCKEKGQECQCGGNCSCNEAPIPMDGVVPVE